MTDEELLDIYTKAGGDVPKPYPSGTPDAEQEVEPWTAYHGEVLVKRLRALADKAWGDGRDSVLVSGIK